MKIDMNEVQSNKTKLATSIKLMRGQVELARSKLNQIVESQALQGDVKTAIDAKVKNHQMPMMTHYLTALEIMSADYEALISTFQSEVGESAQDAVIDTDYLAELGTIFPGISQGLATIRQSLSGTYSRISDLITLDASSTSDISSNLSAAKQILTDTTDKMSAFNDLPRPETFSSIISQQNAQLGVLRSVQGPQYATEKARALYTNQNFALSVTQYQLLSHQSNYRVMLQQKLARSLVDSYYSKRPVQASMQPYKLDAKTKDLIEKANKGDLQAISELSKSYRYDKTMERTVPYRSQTEFARLNQEVWDRTLTTGQHILGEIFGIYDVYRLITGIDPVTGEETSRLEAGLWLALDILPFLKAGKAGKLGKIAKTADKVDDVADAVKAVDKTTDTAKAVDKASDIVKIVDVDRINDTANIIRNSGGETIAGHALQKHAGRNPQIWGAVKGNSESINRQAMEHINDILKSPGDFMIHTTDRGISFLEKKLPDGRGMRLNMDGSFKGFIDK